MVEIGEFEAKNTLGSLLDRVENSEEIVITRHGRRVARLVPNNLDREQQQKAWAALERIRARAKELKPGPFDWEVYKKDRDEGRP